MAIKRNLMGSTLKKTKINKNTFSMGGGSLADKVANNSRKITLIKNVISTGKSDLGSQLASLDGRSNSPQSDLTEINDTLNDIGNALALDFANRIAIEKGENKRLKTDASKQKNKRAENRIENALIGGLSGIVAPIAKQGQKVADAMSLLALSAVGNAVFEGLKKDEKDDTSLLKKTTDAAKGAFFKNTFLNPKVLDAGKFLLNKTADAGKFLLNKTGDFFKNISKPSKAIINDKIETTENQVNQLKKEGFKEGEARVLVEATKPIQDQIFPLTTNITGDVGGNAFSGLMFNKIVNDRNLRKVKNQQGKITEITLPVEKLANSISPKSASGSETTVIPYVTSVNVANKDMTKTPEIHGIILD